MTLKAPQVVEHQLAVLPDLFDRSALRWPDATAVEIPPATARAHRRKVSYKSLRTQSDNVAKTILLTGGSGGVVAVFLPRTTEQLYIGQLAALKSGAAYVCLDPAFPNEHLRHVLDDSVPDVLLTDSTGFDRAITIGYSWPVIRLGPPLESVPWNPPHPRTDSTAYLISTL